MISLEDVVVEYTADGVAVVNFTGEHDLTTSDVVYELLASLVSRRALVVADFSQALFVDSSLLEKLLATARLARETGTSFRLRLNGPAFVRRVFEVSGILETIPWSHTRNGALDTTHYEFRTKRDQIPA